jgi:ubiquitin C-terminal hydrolase
MPALPLSALQPSKQLTNISFTNKSEGLNTNSKSKTSVATKSIIASPVKIGPGLQNLGNTCFLNSILQCLTYTTPLQTFLLSLKKHREQCKKANQFCIVCSMQNHVRACLSSNDKNRPIAPRSFASNLRKIAKQFRLGRQEGNQVS